MTMDELMPRPDRLGLSEAGLARRNEILDRALRAQRWRVRRRRSVQGAASAAVVVAMLLAARMTFAPSAPGPVGPIASHDAPAETSAHPRVQIVSTSPATYERLAHAGDDDGIEVIDDDELLALLRGAGRQAGIVRVQGRVEVVGEAGVISPVARDDATSG
jgi:hypothetical protein